MAYWRLAQISHPFAAVAEHLAESTALRSKQGLDALGSTPARPISRVPSLATW